MTEEPPPCQNRQVHIENSRSTIVLFAGASKPSRLLQLVLTHATYWPTRHSNSQPTTSHNILPIDFWLFSSYFMFASCYPLLTTDPVSTIIMSSSACTMMHPPPWHLHHHHVIVSMHHSTSTSTMVHADDDMMMVEVSWWRMHHGACWRWHDDGGHRVRCKEWVATSKHKIRRKQPEIYRENVVRCSGLWVRVSSGSVGSVRKH